MSAAASDKALRQVGLRALRGIQPVGGKHLGRPGWLMNRSSGPHLYEVRRYVEDGSAVHSVQVGDDEVPAIRLEQSRIADRQLVGAPVVAVDERSGRRPDRVSPWAARVELHVFGTRQVEAPGHCEVGELLGTLQRFEREGVVQ